MSKKVFTDQEVEMLRRNQYTYLVTPRKLLFTKKFKELFWNEYQAGAIPRKILEKYGYSAAILGEKRIWGITATIKKQNHSSEGLHEGTLPRNPVTGGTESKSHDEQLQQLQGEVLYLRQEIAFLKKILLIRTSRK
ncbi:MAG: hypothetical protein IJS54_03190 [Desulfovibrio sp.]|nr:hypothetical protein [Desulfovibrio sp.]